MCQNLSCRNLLPRAILALGMVGLLATPALSDEATDKAPAALAKAFVSFCVQSMPNLDQLEATAASRGWRHLEGAEAAKFAAPSPDAKTTSWEVRTFADVPFSLSITRGVENRRNVAVCTIINADVPPAPVKAALVDLLTIKEPFRTEDEGDQHYTYWRAKFEGTEIIVGLSETGDPAENGVNLSATVIQRLN